MEPRRTEYDEVAQSLPDDCTLDEFRYRLYLRIKVDERLAAIAAGETFTREEVAGQIKAWKEIRSTCLPRRRSLIGRWAHPGRLQARPEQPFPPQLLRCRELACRGRRQTGCGTPIARSAHRFVPPMPLLPGVWSAEISLGRSVGLGL